MVNPLLTPVYDAVICPWSAAHPRHDHQLIFPLSDGRLFHIWSEYYADRPSFAVRSVFDQHGAASDEFSCRLSGAVSSDRGRSWSDVFTVQENLWGRNVKHPNLIRLKNNDLLLTFTAWESEDRRNIYMKRSTDEAETWGEIEQISAPGWYCTNNDHIVRLSTGRILLPSHGGPGFRFVKGNPLHSFVFISDDEGKTWRLSADTMTAPGRGAHEPSVVELKDGRLLCMLRTTQGCVYKSFSDDQGDHWTRPVPTDFPAPDAPPLIRRIPGGGDLLMIWNNIRSNRNRPRIPLTASVSTDEGETWGPFMDIDQRPDHDAAYAAVLFLDDEALITYYARRTDWARDSEICLKVIPTAAFYGGS